MIQTSPVYLSVFLMRFSFAFTVVALQWLVPIQVDRGVISSAYPIMEMATGFVFGILADRVGRKWIVVGALFASSLISFSSTLTRSFPLLVVIHGLQGVCAAAIVTGTLALLADIAKKTTRGREMGIYDSSTLVGYGFGFVLALVLINNDPSRDLLPFYAGASIALVGGIVSALTLKNVRWTSMIQRYSIRDNLRAITGDRVALTLIPAWFVLMVVIGVFLTFTREVFSVVNSGSGASFLDSRVTHSLSGAGIGILAIIAVLVGGLLLGLAQSGLGSLSDKFGRTRLVLIGQGSILGILLMLIGIFYFHLSVLILSPFVVLFGAGLLAFTPAALAELADVAPETGRGAAMGLYSVTVGAGTIFGPLAGGALISAYGTHVGLTFLFAFGAGIMIILIAYQAGYYLMARK